jgi:hypothetical protein
MKDLVFIMLCGAITLIILFRGAEHTREIDRMLELHDCQEYDRLRNYDRTIYICKEKDHG